MSPTTSNLRFPSYLMGIYVFCPTEKGHCLTLSYKPVPPLSFKKRSKFFNQKKMYTDAVSFKAGHFHWVFHIRWPTSATAAHYKTNTFLNKNLLPLWNCSYFPYKCKPGAHHLEPSTALYFCHGVFTDKPTFSLNLLRTRTPRESTSTYQD